MEDNYEWGTVVGVVKDYVAQSAYQPQASVALVNSLERRWEANKRNLILKEPFKENLSRIRDERNISYGGYSVPFCSSGGR